MDVVGGDRGSAPSACFHHGWPTAFSMNRPRSSLELGGSSSRRRGATSASDGERIEGPRPGRAQARIGAACSPTSARNGVEQLVFHGRRPLGAQLRIFASPGLSSGVMKRSRLASVWRRMPVAGTVAALARCSTERNVAEGAEFGNTAGAGRVMRWARPSGPPAQPAGLGDRRGGARAIERYWSTPSMGSGHPPRRLSDAPDSLEAMAGAGWRPVQPSSGGRWWSAPQSGGLSAAFQQAEPSWGSRSGQVGQGHQIPG